MALSLGQSSINILPPDVFKTFYPTFKALLKILSYIDWRDG